MTRLLEQAAAFLTAAPRRGCVNEIWTEK